MNKEGWKRKKRSGVPKDGNSSDPTIKEGGNGIS
jgi:hypothetical protein